MPRGSSLSYLGTVRRQGASVVGRFSAQLPTIDMSQQRKISDADSKQAIHEKSVSGHVHRWCVASIRCGTAAFDLNTTEDSRDPFSFRPRMPVSGREERGRSIVVKTIYMGQYLPFSASSRTLQLAILNDETVT